MKKYLTTALFVIFLCIITVSMCGCSLFNKGDESKSEEVKIESEEVIDSVTGKNIFLKAVSNTCYATDDISPLGQKYLEEILKFKDKALI